MNSSFSSKTMEHVIVKFSLPKCGQMMLAVKLEFHTDTIKIPFVFIHHGLLTKIDFN
jgi:hypothetical protein